MTPNGQKICSKCELVMSNFMLLQITLQKKQQQSQQPSTIEPSSLISPQSQSSSSVQTPNASSPATFASKLNASSRSTSSQVPLKPLNATLPSAEQPPNKLPKLEKFAVNDLVMYFDTNTNTMKDAVVIQIMNLKVCKIANSEHDVFPINIKFLTKK